MIIAFIILLTVGVGYYFYESRQEEEIVVEKTEIKKKSTKKEEEINDTFVSVDIKGEVNVPGMYSVKTSMRILDVIQEAGGLTEAADTSVINLSKKVVDEMVIIIYSKEQVHNFEETKKQEDYLLSKCRMPDENSIQNDACIDTGNNTSSKVNINTATKEQLMDLEGIGESKARDIITYRDQNGGFKSIEEIKNVPGIGESIYAQIKETITV